MADKRRKKVTRDVMYTLRMTEEERQLLESAAKLVGSQTSSWLRSLGVTAARKILAAQG